MASACRRPSAPPPRRRRRGGCAGGERLKAGRHELEFAGQTRVFLLSLPEGDGPHPVLLNLHGLGSNARRQAASTPAPGVRLRTWTGCTGGARVRLYTISGGGHTWPGPIEVSRLGATNRHLDATRLILDAFDAAPLA